MKYAALILGVFLVLASTVSAEEYLETSCQSSLQDDLVNVVKVADWGGGPNIFVGTSVNGIVYNYAYIGSKCNTEWTALGSGGWSYNSEGTVKSIVVADLNKDGRKQVVINSVKSNHPGSQTPSEYVEVLTDNGLVDWNFNKECGLTHSVYAEDIDGTGKLNVVMGTQSSKVCVLKDDTKQKDAVLWSYDTGKYPVQHVESADLDGDGRIETVALASKYGDAYVYVLSDTGNLVWEKQLVGGVYTAMIADNIIDVADVDADGVKEIVVGTYEQGVLALNADGTVKFSFDTGNIVSAVNAVGADGVVFAGSAPNIYAVDSRGNAKWMWTADVDSTIYSLSAYDIDADGREEVAAGSTKFLYVLDDDGSLIGSWKYTIEVAGFTKKYEEREADAKSVVMADVDSDGDTEVIAGWNWEQTTVRGNAYSSDIRVYEINKEYTPEAPSTTLSETPTTMVSETTLAPATTMQAYETTTTMADEEDEDGGGLCCLPMLPAVLALGLAIVGKIPFAAVKH